MSAAPLTVAIASENDLFDGEIYRSLLEQILGRPVIRWRTEMRFDGHRAIYKLSDPFLDRAHQTGIKHALVAVDNDGGLKRRPEHDPASCPVSKDPSIVIDIDDDVTCRYCWLSSAIPTSWTKRGGLLCLAVPVQTIETWLLHLRGDALEPSPERVFDRPNLKKRFFGRPLPPAAERLAAALAQVQRSDALDRLRERRSFALFESQLSAWGTT